LWEVGGVATRKLLSREAGGWDPAEGRDARESGEAADAIRAFGLEAVGRVGMLVASVMGTGVVGMAAVAVFDGGGGECGQGGSCAGGGTSVSFISVPGLGQRDWWSEGG